MNQTKPQSFAGRFFVSAFSVSALGFAASAGAEIFSVGTPVSPAGEIVHEYAKVNTAGRDEKTYCRGGDKLSLFEIDGILCTLVICRDGVIDAVAEKLLAVEHEAHVAGWHHLIDDGAFERRHETVLNELFVAEWLLEFPGLDHLGQPVPILFIRDARINPHRMAFQILDPPQRKLSRSQ